MCATLVVADIFHQYTYSIVQITIKYHVYICTSSMPTRTDTNVSAHYHTLLLSNSQQPNLQLTPLCRAQRLLTHSLYERLKSSDGLVRRDFMASFKHVQERKFASGLECTVLHAIDGVRHQRLRVELGRLGELDLRDDGLHAGGVANPVCVRRQKKEIVSHGLVARRQFLPASPAQIST